MNKSSLSTAILYIKTEAAIHLLCVGQTLLPKNMLWQIFHHSMDVFSVFSPYHSLTVRSAVNSKLRSQG